MNATEDKKLTTKEAAEQLGVAPGTLENWRIIGDGRGPEYVKLGGKKRGPVRYLQSQIDAYLKKKTRTHT